MTALRRLLPLLTLCLSLAMACTDAAKPGGKGGVSDLIVPKAANGIVLDKPTGGDDGGALAGGGHEAKVALDPNMLVQGILEENVDTDPAIEQLVIFKNKSDPDDLLHLMVVDYDEAHAQWSPTWQAATRAVNIKTFMVRVMDLTADGLPELVCQGTDKAGNLTLDVFKRASPAPQFPLAYAPILSIGADISLEVQSAEPVAAETGDDASAAGVKAKPVDIVAQAKDLESQNPLDMVQTVYRWKESRDNPAGGQYLVAASQKVPGNTVQETALDQLYRGSAQDIERKYLAGAWIHSYVNQRKKSIDQILFFDPQSRTVRLIEGDRMESHQWASTRKPPYGGSLEASLVNENFKSLHSMAAIQVKDLNLLSFALTDRNDWTGDFQRLSAEQEERYFAHTLQRVPIDKLILNGLFRSESGQEIVFSPPRFSWRDGAARSQGSFITYQLNDTVLECTFTDSRGLTDRVAYFIAKVDENNQARAKVLRLLTLYPAVLTVDGVSRDPGAGDALHLEQLAADVAP